MGFYGFIRDNTPNSWVDWESKAMPDMRRNDAQTRNPDIFAPIRCDPPVLSTPARHALAMTTAGAFAAIDTLFSISLWISLWKY